MPTVVAEYGPPGHKGVTSIMGLGANDLEPAPYQQSNRTVGMVAVGVWALGALSGNRKLRDFGFGAGLAVFAAGLLTRRAEQKAAGAPATSSPVAQQGW
jgi:hypothetical protein